MNLIFSNVTNNSESSDWSQKNKTSETIRSDRKTRADLLSNRFVKYFLGRQQHKSTHGLLRMPRTSRRATMLLSLRRKLRMRMWLFLLQTNEEDGDQNEEEDELEEANMDMILLACQLQRTEQRRYLGRLPYRQHHSKTILMCKR